MTGKSPIRRTLRYLEAGKLFLNDKIQIMSINYNPKGAHHHGIREFVYWYLPQVQYKNPNVQMLTLKNMTPSPFIRFIYESGEQMLVDCDNKSHEVILKHLIQVVGKSDKVRALERQLAEIKVNPANFGRSCARPCICVVSGQVPCPGVVPLPNHMRGKFKYAKD